MKIKMVHVLGLMVLMSGGALFAAHWHSETPRFLSAIEAAAVRGGQVCYMNSSAQCTNISCAGCSNPPNGIPQCLNTVAEETLAVPQGGSYPKAVAFDPAVAILGQTKTTVSTASCGLKVACKVNMDCEFFGVGNWRCRLGGSSAWNPGDATELSYASDSFACPRRE